MRGFHRPDTPRDQIVLFPTKLDEIVEPTHPVRHFEEILNEPIFASLFRQWEREDDGTEGRPPYHPKYMARLYLYGMMRGLRSTRRLESACRGQVDFMWLMVGQKPDHATIAEFFRKHTERLGALYRQTLFVAANIGLVKLDAVAVDGTKLRANSKRSTSHRETIEAELAVMAQVEKEAENQESEWKRNETAEGQLWKDQEGWVPPKKKAGRDVVAERRKRLEHALVVLERRKNEAGPQWRPVLRTSRSDPDSRPMKDKEGITRPAYNAQVSVDTETGIVVAADVIDRADDCGQFSVMVAKVEANTGIEVKVAVADAGYNTGAELQRLDERNVEAYLPPSSGREAPLSAEQKALIEAVGRGEALSPEQADTLPRGANGQISRIAFVFDSEQDGYRCPGGALLPRRKVCTERKAGGTTLRSVFHDKAACSTCPLASQCLSKGASRRLVSRDQYEELRVEMRERMATPKGKRLYRQRSWAAETPWAYMKWTLGFTRFLRRGLASVRAEVLLACASLNMVRIQAKLDSG